MQRDRWRFAPFIHEAVRNVFDVRAKLFPSLVLSVLAGSALAGVAALESLALEDQLAALQHDGRLVYDIASTDPQTPVQISRASCEALAAQPGVERAGLVQIEGFYDLPAHTL